MNWRRHGYIDDAAVQLIPAWLLPLAHAVPQISTDDLTRFAPTDGSGRAASVLVLFGDGPDVLLIKRASGDVAHAGQPAFPGGAREAEDVDEFAAALREAEEETGLRPSGVRVFGALPDLWVPVSDYVVSPILGHWHAPNNVEVQDVLEVSRVERVPLGELVDPANRYTAVHPSGYRSPAFFIRDMLIWGFTAGVLSGVLDISGWAQPWDRDRTMTVDT